MLKTILLCASIASLTGGLACQSSQAEEASGAGGTQRIDGGSGTSAAGHGGDPAPAGQGLASASGSGAAMAAAEVEFADSAFPPTLPSDEAHANPWLRDDCLLCHETGTGGAPIVQHSGMSKILLSARCRSCHVEVAPDAPDDGEVPFARNAFPPTLPDDDYHRGAWLRDDCLLCHETGIQGAPRVVHNGMTPMLLQARCRSCHVPSVASEQADRPLK